MAVSGLSDTASASCKNLDLAPLSLRFLQLHLQHHPAPTIPFRQSSIALTASFPPSASYRNLDLRSGKSSSASLAPDEKSAPEKVAHLPRSAAHRNLDLRPGKPAVSVLAPHKKFTRQKGVPFSQPASCKNLDLAPLSLRFLQLHLQHHPVPAIPFRQSSIALTAFFPRSEEIRHRACPLAPLDRGAAAEGG